uniref:Arc-like DNA binding domain-containing protein n=1 Tax=Pseudomonas fluorescens TaxID=294 RepID=A0A220ITC0_PSEFL|nr:Arc family DNA-binding protein [Pseudomonas fluorescens]ASI38104.1 Hypothetical protein [Pseudomonas fluorescens]AWH58701.1 Hypothetical protein [Pseudomonas fluorescens]
MDNQIANRNSEKFVVRLPEGFREKIDAAAVEAQCSMNSIFILALRHYLIGQARQALLLDALEAKLASLDKSQADQIATINRAIKVSPAAVESIHNARRIEQAAAEPVFLTVVFELPSAQVAAPLINQLPCGQSALGTQAKVFSITTGNLMARKPY